MLLKIPVVTRLVWNIYVSFHNSWGPQKATEKVQLNRDWLLAKTVEKQRKLGYVSYDRPTRSVNCSVVRIWNYIHRMLQNSEVGVSAVVTNTSYKDGNKPNPAWSRPNSVTK